MNNGNDDIKRELRRHDPVAPGELDPDTIHTPGIYVSRIVQGKNYEKRIEQRTISQKVAA